MCYMHKLEFFVQERVIIYLPKIPALSCSYLASQFSSGAKALVQRCSQSVLLHINTNKDYLLTAISSLREHITIYNIHL